MHKRFSFDYVKNFLNEHLYILLEEEYINAHVKLKMKCPKEHISYRTFDSFKSGNRCNICSTEKTASKQRHTIEFIRKQLLKENYILLSSEYKNASSKLEIKCPKEHVTKFNWNFFQGGGRCPICFGTPKKTIDEVKKFASSINYILLSTEYKNARDKLKFKCPNNHIFEVSWNNFSGSSGSRCPLCWFINNRGSSHCNWKGGISFDDYCEIFQDKEFKDYIKYRDGYKCLNPLCNKKTKTLSVHHVDYNKKNCSQENLITLCVSCNSSANIDRKWHTSWYQAILFNRYKYSYKKE
jgi:hypothetical protein